MLVLTDLAAPSAAATQVIGAVEAIGLGFVDARKITPRPVHSNKRLMSSKRENIGKPVIVLSH